MLLLYLLLVSRSGALKLALSHEQASVANYGELAQALLSV